MANDQTCKTCGAPVTQNVHGEVWNTCNARIEALQAENARLRGEVERIKNLVPLAYGEALVDISTRGLNEENIDLIFDTSDAKAAMDCAETHQREWPDNYDDAMNRATLQQDKEGE